MRRVMHRVDTLLWVLFLSIVGCGFCQVNLVSCPQHPKPIPLPDALPQVLVDALARLESDVENVMHKNNMVGASAAIVYEQRQLWARGFGVSDRKTMKPVTTDTLFRIGSITKLFTVLSLLQLRDAGKVSVDDTVQKYWPNFSVRSKYSGNSRGITFRELASQLSGVFSGSPCSYLDSCNITTDEAFARISQEQVVLPSDLQPHYSDVTFAILGRALERPSAMSWEDMVTKWTLEPLGMNSTGYDFSQPDVKERLATGYMQNSSLPYWVAATDMGWARPTGQLYSNVNDLSKLLSLLFTYDSTTSNKVLLGSSIREIFLPAFVNDDQATGFGFPFERGYLDAVLQKGLKYWGVIKGGAFPGFTSTILTIPVLKIGFVAQNNGQSSSSLLQPFASFLATFEKYLQANAPPPPAYPGNLTSFVGLYRGRLGILPVNQKITLQQEKWVDGSIVERLHLATGEDTILEWLEGDSFQLKLNVTSSTTGCLPLEMGQNNEIIFFQKQGEEVVSFTLPGTDPYYGVVFKKYA